MPNPFKKDKIDKLTQLIQRDLFDQTVNDLSVPHEGAIAIHKPAEQNGGGGTWWLTDRELIQLAKIVVKVYPDEFK